MDREQLKLELKQMIIKECEKHMRPEQIPDDAILIGSEGSLALDSLDALQIALAVKQQYGKRIDGNNKTRAALTSINTLADFILADKIF
ncbi:MAG TPA: acyl carrier protein [Gammaproteobacteria bacterium]|nr:acyl carrier protein [Gammaproteobacteria bacterium]